MNDETASAVRGEARAGSRALAIFGHALNGGVLRAHADGPLRFSQLEDLLPWAPQTSLRLAVNEMCELGALVKAAPAVGTRGSPSDLTPCGRDLLAVGDSLERWLLRSPTGPIAPTSPAGPSAIRALLGGWDSTIVRELAEGPLTQTELSARIAGESYHALGRRLGKLRSTRLVIQLSEGRERPFEVSDWLRHAIAPLCVAARWERNHMGAVSSPIARLEVEAAFLLTLPLVALPRGRGTCALAVMTSPGRGQGGESEVAGVTVEVEDGTVVSCLSTEAFSPATWALGSPDAWLDAVVDGRSYQLRVQGEDVRLPVRIVQEIHDRLFSD